MKIKVLLLIMLIGWLCKKSHAINEPNFSNIDVKSGLSDNYIQSIMQDRYGFIWIATLNGLNCYDGYRVKTYYIMPLGDYNNNIKEVMEDASGTIWIKGPSCYYVYNREQDAITNRAAALLSTYGIEGNASYLAVDRTRNLWCRAGDKLYKYDFQKKCLSAVRIPEGMQENILGLEACGDTAFLLLSSGKIIRIVMGSGEVNLETEQKLGHRLQYRIYRDGADRLWFYASHQLGLKYYDIKRKTWKEYHRTPELEDALITAVLDDKDGNFWIGTDNKGVCLVGEDGVSWLKRQPGNHFALPDNHINCFFKDKQNTIWIGTGKRGVAYASLDKIVFKTFDMPHQEDVRCIQEDNEGNIWLGSDGEGLFCKQKDGSSKLFRKKDGIIPSNMIICSFVDSDERLWLGSYDKGVFYQKDGKFISLDYVRPDGNRPLQRINRIVEDKEGTLWFSTFMEGLFAMRRDGSFAEYTMNASTLRTNSILDLSYPGGNLLYVGTSSGLYTVNIHNREISAMLDKEMPDSHITCLLYDSRGLLWIGTRKGLSVWDKKKGIVACLNEANGLSHNYVRGIVEDKYHNLWVTTDNGVNNVIVTDSPLDASRRFVCLPYFEEDGIGHFTFNTHAIVCCSSGEILMGGIGGCLKSLPKNTYHRYGNNRVVFTNLLINEQKVNVGDTIGKNRVPLPKSLQLLDEIKLDYSDNSFTLEVSSMDYSDLHKLSYVYRFGDNGQWMKMEGNQIHFNKLNPGNFLLQVKVYEPEGMETNTVSTLMVHIRPPFYRSTEAYLFYAFLISLLSFGVFRHMQVKHKRMLEQQKREMEITQQHELDEARMRFFTNVSHDLRTPLSLIAIPLKKILSSFDLPSELRKELALIQRNTDALLNEVNQLLDFRKLDKQREQFLPSYGNLSEFVKNIHETFKEMSAQSDVMFVLDVVSPDIETSFDKDKMQRILLNLFSNAVKYNKKGGQVCVTVDKTSGEEGDYARIQVADTGIGIKKENKEKVFERFFQEQHVTTYMGSGIGLHIVKEYVEMHQGRIWVEDNIPEGCIFVLLLPIVAKERTDTDMKEKQTESITGLSEKDKASRVSVLLVEDNDDFRRFMVDCLQPRYQVFDAVNGQEALSILEKHPVQIVISDVMMPVMDGLELCHQIKTDLRFSHIPVILLTAKSADEHILSGLQEGADEYITKPFNLDILFMRIQKLLDWTRANHERFKTVDLAPSEITVSTLDEELIQKAIRIIEENMDNSEFSVEDFSMQIGISRSGLYKKLMSITGKSPLEFIRIIRLKRGRQLLEGGQSNISQVAYQVGLSPKQFAKYFKEQFGELPSDYINKRR